MYEIKFYSVLFQFSIDLLKHKNILLIPKWINRTMIKALLSVKQYIFKKYLIIRYSATKIFVKNLNSQILQMRY